MASVHYAHGKYEEALDPIKKIRSSMGGSTWWSLAYFPQKMADVYSSQGNYMEDGAQREPLLEAQRPNFSVWREGEAGAPGQDILPHGKHEVKYGNSQGP